MDIRNILGKLDQLNEGTMAQAKAKPTGPKFGKGKWKGTDPASAAKDKYVGGESILRDLESKLNEDPVKRDLSKEFRAFKEAYDHNAPFNAADFNRHMEQLRAREELRKTDPMKALVGDLIDKDNAARNVKKKPQDDDSIGINDPRHPGWGALHNPLGEGYSEDDGIYIGAKVYHKEHQSGEPFEVVKILDDQRVGVIDEYGNKKAMFIDKLVPAQQEVDESPEEALKYATKAHAGQTRSGGDPYISHPVRVANHIKQYKQSHNLDALISAAYLHDTIEDTDTTHEALHDLFGGLVASLVKELTSDPEQIKKMGKAAYLSHKMAAMSSYALVIKLADRLDNVKDITTARTPQWRAKYAAETNQILNYIEKNRALSGTHNKLISLIRAKLAEIDNPQQGVAEGVNVAQPGQRVTVINPPRMIDVLPGDTYEVRTSDPEGVTLNHGLGTRYDNVKFPHGTYKIANAQGLKEFAPTSDDSDGNDDVLFQFAQMWYSAPNIATQQQVEQALAKAGWEIGELESEEGGAYVMRIGDEEGDSYIGWSEEQLADISEDISRRGFLKGAGAAAAAGAAGKAGAIAGAFPTPSHQAAMYKAAADSNAAQARADAAEKAKRDAQRLKQSTGDVERLNKINFHGGKVTPINATWDGDSDFMDVDGTKYAMASRMPIRGNEPSNMKLVSTHEGHQVYMWTRNSLKGVVGRYFYPAPAGSSQINEFAPGNGDDGLPYAEYQVYQCNPLDQFDWIGGPLYQTDNMGMAHKYAYEKYVKHRPKAFMVWQERSQGSRGNYGVKDESDHDEDLKEFAVDKGDNGDGRSQLIGSIAQLLQAKKKVDFYVPGIRGHVAGIGGNGDWVTLKRWNKPYSKINYSLALDSSDDKRFSLKMIRPDYYQVVQAGDLDESWVAAVAEGFSELDLAVMEGGHELIKEAPVAPVQPGAAPAPAAGKPTLGADLTKPAAQQAAQQQQKTQQAQQAAAQKEKLQQASLTKGVNSLKSAGAAVSNPNQVVKAFDKAENNQGLTPADKNSIASAGTVLAPIMANPQLQGKFKDLVTQASAEQMKAQQQAKQQQTQAAGAPVAGQVK